MSGTDLSGLGRGNAQRPADPKTGLVRFGHMRLERLSAGPFGVDHLACSSPHGDRPILTSSIEFSSAASAGFARTLSVRHRRARSTHLPGSACEVGGCVGRPDAGRVGTAPRVRSVERRLRRLPMRRGR